MSRKPITVREFDKITAKSDSLGSQDDFNCLKKFALANLYDKDNKYKPLLIVRNKDLIAQNHVGILQLPNGRIIEILPKLGLGAATSDDATKNYFLQMLSRWRHFKKNRIATSQTAIQAKKNFTMFDVFIDLFLHELTQLVQQGIMRDYQLHEENLLYLRGQLQFNKHIAANFSDATRFYVAHDQFTDNVAANRLIHLALSRLTQLCQHASLLRRINELKMMFDGIALSDNPQADREKYHLQRNITHYKSAMEWVNLFLFNEGLTTYSGKYLNKCLLFPMEQIFEDFVADSFRRYQTSLQVKTQDKSHHLMRYKKHLMRPDILLVREGEQTSSFVLDTKWKRITDKKDASTQDLYQLFAYAKRYNCSKTALIYPWQKGLKSSQPLTYFDGSQLYLFPFDVANPQNSVESIVTQLQKIV